jgi:hypothetical protein
MTGNHIGDFVVKLTLIKEEDLFALVIVDKLNCDVYHNFNIFVIHRVIYDNQ